MFTKENYTYASHGSFNPYNITSKQAHIVNGKIKVSNIKNNKATSVFHSTVTGDG